MKDSDFSQDFDAIKAYFATRFKHVNQANALQLQIMEIGVRGVTLMLPYNDFIVGDPDTKVIHGGALSTLLDHTCGSSIIRALYPKDVITPTLDLRVDHLTSAEPHKPVYAYAEVYRVTKSVVFTKGVAYQDDINEPISHAIASFMSMELGPRDEVMANTLKAQELKTQELKSQTQNSEGK